MSAESTPPVPESSSNEEPNEFGSYPQDQSTTPEVATDNPTTSPVSTPKREFAEIVPYSYAVIDHPDNAGHILRAHSFASIHREPTKTLYDWRYERKASQDGINLSPGQPVGRRIVALGSEDDPEKIKVGDVKYEAPYEPANWEIRKARVGSALGRLLRRKPSSAHHNAHSDDNHFTFEQDDADRAAMASNPKLFEREKLLDLHGKLQRADGPEAKQQILEEHAGKDSAPELHGSLERMAKVASEQALGESMIASLRSVDAHNKERAEFRRRMQAEHEERLANRRAKRHDPTDAAAGAGESGPVNTRLYPGLFDKSVYRDVLDEIYRLSDEYLNTLPSEDAMSAAEIDQRDAELENIRNEVIDRYLIDGAGYDVEPNVARAFTDKIEEYEVSMESENAHDEASNEATTLDEAATEQAHDYRNDPDYEIFFDDESLTELQELVKPAIKGALKRRANELGVNHVPDDEAAKIREDISKHKTREFIGSTANDELIRQLTKARLDRFEPRTKHAE